MHIMDSRNNTIVRVPHTGNTYQHKCKQMLKPKCITKNRYACIPFMLALKPLPLLLSCFLLFFIFNNLKILPWNFIKLESTCMHLCVHIIFEQKLKQKKKCDILQVNWGCLSFPHVISSLLP